MKRVIGNCLVALGLAWLVLLIWMTPVQVRPSDGVVERVWTNWSAIAVNVVIGAAMVWGGISLRRRVRT